ncbi:MAG: TerC family protein [Blastocatellia bacterium]|nr:TerC family protein [Blastocatellia bacterium]MBL8192556.1 TerC family protein [Blastocatellia bacterium]
MSQQTLAWVGFHVFILFMLALDLGLVRRKAREVSLKEALAWSAVWISLAMVFNGFIYYWLGSEKALSFLAGYLIEKSLSVDNLFVFLLVFSYFKVPPLYQHKILFWGILGALFMRAVFIIAGIALISYFHFVIYIFGAFLIFTGIKLVMEKDEDIEPEKNPVLKFVRKFIPIKTEYGVGKFFLRENGKLYATQLFVVLVVVETTDVIFAVDSIPAILAITPDPFIVYTSNIMAILGLRALYFALSGIMGMFHYLSYGLCFILVFIGVKMMISDFYKIPIAVALGVIAGVLTISIVLSIVFKPQEAEKSVEPGQ